VAVTRAMNGIMVRVLELRKKMPRKLNSSSVTAAKVAETF
jgi:hypothetical protein